MIDKMSRVPVREVWKHEAKDFTTWLFNNLDILVEELDFETLTPIEQEKTVGSFSADIIAEDESGQDVVIENQLEKTDHDHLGKILTYVSNLDAKVAIWISNKPREEHVTAIEWLNKNVNDTRFYLVKIEAYRIGNSNPAPKFTVVTGPSETTDLVRKEKTATVERYRLNREFWTELLKRTNQKTNLYSNISPGKGSWIRASSGKPGLSYYYKISKKAAGAGLYIDCGKKSKIENKKIYDKLFIHKDEIENNFNGKLEWHRSDDINGSFIRKLINSDQYTRKEDWPALQDEMINTMIRLEKAFRKHIRNLSI